MDIISSQERPRLAPSSLRSLILRRDLQHLELPNLSDLTSALTALAQGRRRKALLPLTRTVAELALVRRGDDICVSHYETGAVPQVHQLDRRVPLEPLLRRAAHALLEQARSETDNTARQIGERLAERALRARLEPDPDANLSPSIVRGGSASPEEDEPLSFGFEARFTPGRDSGGNVARADIHAMLFDGELWAFVRGRRIAIGRGPIMLVVQRMVSATRSLVEAYTKGRAANVRLRAGEFAIEAKIDKAGMCELRLATPERDLSANALRVDQTVHPILRITSELVRALITSEKAQSRNLRVTALRDEVRQMRRALRAHEGAESEHSRRSADPEAVRLAVQPGDEKKTTLSGATLPNVGRNMRYEERWRVALDDLDAASTYFCGDRLVIGSNSHTVALQRDSGEVLWARSAARRTLMAGRTLLRTLADGEIELCDVSDGEPFAIARAASVSQGARFLLSGSTDAPYAILDEGRGRLVAIDLRTGEPHWRFSARRSPRLRTFRYRRLLLIVADGAICALDMNTGDEHWRYEGAIDGTPHVAGDVCIVTSTRSDKVFGIDLFSGELRWERRLTAPARKMRSAEHALLISDEADQLFALDASTGERIWTGADPGLGHGASCIAVDGLAVFNVPGGTSCAIDLEDGEVRWMHLLSDAFADEIPRSLEPVLRGAALFMPARSVHILRPTDGEILGEIDTDLVPDRFRVDERGWVYVAEESGHVAAYAPAPTLRLIRGGK